jgi:hypothetical protein
MAACCWNERRDNANEIIMHIAWVLESGGRRRHDSGNQLIGLLAALSQYQRISDPYIVPIRGAIPHLPDLYYHNTTLACIVNHFI